MVTFRSYCNNTPSTSTDHAVAGLMTRCGAMFSGSTTAIPVKTNPEGAKVYLNGEYVGKSPQVLSVKSKEKHMVDVEADGYTRRTVTIEPEVNGGYIALDCLLLLLFVIPGVIALVVDSGGGWHEAKPDNLGIRLDRAAPPKSVAPSAPPEQPPPPQIETPEPKSDPEPAAQPSEPRAPTLAGCQYDTQCKGEKICVDGNCVEPFK